MINFFEKSRMRRRGLVSGNPEKTYEIGYRRPPKATRFKKGKSGNPSGKRKQSANTIDPATIIFAIGNEEIVVVDNGKRKRMKKDEIHFRRLFTKAIKGDLKAARIVMDMAANYCTPDPSREWNYQFIGETEAQEIYGKNWQSKVQKLNMLRGFSR